MAVVVTLAEVQQWLESTKMTLTTVDTELAESARVLAFSDISSAYDVSTWISPTSTPKLVRAAISMLIAAWEYQRAYSEEDGSNYGDKLEIRARLLIEGIAGGTTILEELPGEGTTTTSPEFYPDDSTGYSDIYDANDNLIGLAGSEDIKFTMGARY